MTQVLPHSHQPDHMMTEWRGGWISLNPTLFSGTPQGKHREAAMRLLWGVSGLRWSELRSIWIKPGLQKLQERLEFRIMSVPPRVVHKRRAHITALPLYYSGHLLKKHSYETVRANDENWLREKNAIWSSVNLMTSIIFRISRGTSQSYVETPYFCTKMKSRIQWGQLLQSHYSDYWFAPLLHKISCDSLQITHDPEKDL